MARSRQQAEPAEQAQSPTAGQSAPAQQQAGNNAAENIISPAVDEQTVPENGNNDTENIPTDTQEAEQQPSAFERVPKDEQGNPLYEQADTDTAWDAIVEQTEGDEVMAQTVADGMVADKEAALKKIEKAKAKGGVSIAEKIAAEKERKAAIDTAKQELDIWKKIAGTANRRKMEADAERRRIASEEAARLKAEEERLRAEREEAERIEREALNGVPDMVDDTPQDARARGYRRVSGHKIDRQEPIQGLQGKKIAVKFSDNTIPTGRVAVIEAEQLQPSHIGGQRNPLHFIDEAQPKERNDEASVLSARKIAGNIRPEEITSSVTAYTGAPTVNARGEAIQGNSRSDALRQMWESHPEQSAKYKQYLTDHAQEFGLNAEDIAGMQHPVLVNMLDVEDADAITLGQYVAQDTESGGTERIKPKNALQRMGADIRTFANLLLKSSDEETSFAGLVDNNGVDVLKWMSQRGFITPTQYKSAFDSKGNLTAEAKNDLRGIMYQSIFKGGSTRLEEMFNAMPAKAQKAILATAFRDYDSPSTERMIEEIQNSIRAYYALSQDAVFVEAKTFKEARMAAEGWKIQYQIDDVTGDSYLPAENFSNFALLLATMYKGENQSIIQGTFNKLYDLIQGTQEENLFEQPDNTPRTLAQAIKETLNITYNGQRRSNVLVGDSSASQRGQQGSTGNAATGERVEDGERTADSAGSIGVSNDERRRQANLSDTSRRQQNYTPQEEIDENGHPFVVSSDGTTSFGEIREESGLPAAPIKLSEGYQDENGKGYGLVHIEANHGEQIRNAGFASVEEFVSFVAKNYDEDNIRVGKRRDHIGTTTYLIQVTDEHDNTLFIELSRDGSYWNVNSGGIFRKGYSNKKETVVKTEPQQPNNAVSTGSSLSAEDKSGISTTEPNGEPTVSDSKDTTNPPTTNELDEKVETLLAIRDGKREFQQTADEIVADTPDARLATEATVSVLTDSGIEVVEVSDAEARALLNGPTPGIELMAVEEAKRRADAIESLSPIPVERNTKTKAELQEDYNNLPSVDKDGRKIEFYNSAFKKIYKEGGLFAQVVPQLDEILKQSVLAYSETDNLGGTVRPDGTIHKEHPNVVQFHNYVGKVEINGKEYYVRTTVQEEKSGQTGTHAYMVTEVFLYENTTEGLSLPITTRARGTFDGVVDAKLQQFFDYANGKNVNPEFHIVYHGSGAKFDAFDHSHMGEGEGAQFYGWGTYVTESEEVGMLYGYESRKTFAGDEVVKYIQRVRDGKLYIETLQQEQAELSGMTNYSNPSEKARINGRLKRLGELLEIYKNELASDEADLEMWRAITKEEGVSQLYTVKIPDDNGSNYLYHDKAVSNKVVADVKQRLYNILSQSQYKGAEQELREKLDSVFTSGMEGDALYNNVSAYLGGDKQASEFFNSMGFVGIKYPTNYRSEGNTKGQSNYVIFNEADAKIVNRVEFLKTPQGTVYGWTDGRRIYLTREGMNPETPIHEYTHLWARAMMQHNAPGWQSVKDLLRDTPVWQEVLSDPNYAGIHGNEDAVASEVIARLSGNSGAQKMQAMARRLISEGNPDATTLIGRIRQALQEFWNWVGINLFDIQEFESVEEIADRVLWDMVQGTHLGTFDSSQIEFMGSRVEKRRAEIAEHFNGQQLSGNSQSIVNAFALGSKNETIEVNGKRIALKQGNENKAGVSHSLMRHYGTSTGRYSADELLLIPQVIEQGIVAKNGNKISYKLERDGVTYTVTTEHQGNAEIFTNFFTNRKPTEGIRSNTDEQHLSSSQSVSADKVSDFSSNKQESGELFRPETGEPFYSNAEYAVLNIRQEKATPQQWLAMIQKNGGLKSGEDKWIGLSDWLSNNDAKTLTKQEVLDFIAQNQIVIEEVRYSQFGTEFIDEATKKLDAELKEIGWDEMEKRYPGFGEYFEMYGNELVWSEERASIGEYEDFILDNKILTPDVNDNAINETRERYTTEGLANKKEIALVVPTIEPYNLSDEVHFGDAGGGRAVAWVRFGETTDANGNRVLVIDEIQSKRHQDGREKGYSDIDAREKLDNAVNVYRSVTQEYDTYRERLKEKYDYNSFEGSLFDKSKRLTNSLTEEERANLAELKAKQREAADVLDKARDNAKGVPDAPFDKNWHELAMKRMLRYAAENGFDKVAWTTGEQQAKRYDIGTSVNHIHVINSEEERYVSVSPNNGRIIELPTEPDSDVIVSGEYKGQRLQDVFGKELAEKILSVGIGEDARIAGEDLHIGGEGMKGFYDKMLPSFMNKYGKKWGVKVGEVTMPDLQDGYQTMHSVDVTPQMRESVMQGQPLFRPLDPVQEVRIIVAEPHSFKNFAEARTWAKQNIIGTYTNPEIGEVKVSGKAIDKYLSQKAVEQSQSLDAHLSALRVLPQLIENSIVGYVHKDRDENSNIRDIVRLFGAINIGNDVHRVKITVKRYSDKSTPNKAYSYEVIEIESLDGHWTTHTPGADFVPTSKNSITVAKLLKGVETANQLQENIIAATVSAEQMAERLGISIEIDESMPARGSYNPRTGRIRINPTRHSTAEDVQRTVLHEAIGHGGIQAVTGKHFERVCTQVYDMMTTEQRADIRRRHGNLSNEAVGAEYMAEMAETGDYRTTAWEKIKAIVRNMFRSMGITKFTHMGNTENRNKKVMPEHRRASPVVSFRSSQ